jgi:hypothetical protein
MGVMDGTLPPVAAATRAEAFETERFLCIDYTHAPFRPPAWRWHCALAHVQRGDRLRPWEGPAIRSAIQFLRAEGRAISAQGRAIVRRRWPQPRPGGCKPCS